MFPDTPLPELPPASDAAADLPAAVADPVEVLHGLDWGQKIHILGLAHDATADIVRQLAARIVALETIIRRHLPSEGL